VVDRSDFLGFCGWAVVWAVALANKTRRRDASEKKCYALDKSWCGEIGFSDNLLT